MEKMETKVLSIELSFPPPARMLATEMRTVNDDDSNALVDWLFTVCRALKVRTTGIGPIL